MGSNLERGSLLHKRYRIVEILGQGGMGSVYRAVDENLGVDVAVKENLFTTDEYARQFRLEAVILANLRHPNLPRVTDHFVIGDQGQYLIMDFIDGEDLRQRMERSGSVPEEETILVGAAMCDALQYLHTRKPSIIHRDLKPGNVRITPEGHIYLVDFGLAKLIKGGQATTTGARAMTPGYSPPEQYGTARTGPRTDIYSLGATLYAALTGVIPEDGLARAMDNVELTPLRKRCPKTSRKLAGAIEKAMAVRPEDRFQSADEFKHALLTSNVKTQRLEGEPVVSPPPQDPEIGDNSNLDKEIPVDPGESPNFPPPSKPRRKTHSVKWWVYFSFFLLTILLLLFSMIIFLTPITKSILGKLSISTTTLIPGTLPGAQTVPFINPVPSQSKTATPQPSLAVTPTLLPIYIPSITPTQTKTLGPTPTFLGGGNSQLAFASDRTGLPQVYLMNSDGGELRQVTNMAYGACQPAWSPDGKRIVFISPCEKRLKQYPGARMYIINADGSGLIDLAFGEGGDFDPAWSPDGKIISFTSLRDGSPQIYTLNLGDNSVMRLTEPTHEVAWSSQPAWSQNGTKITYTSYSLLTDALQIWEMNNTGTDKKLLIHRGSELWNFLSDWSPDGKTILFSETSGDQQLGWLMLSDYTNQPDNVIHLRLQAYGTHGDYSPDGLWVAYESQDSQDESRVDYDIYRTKADGTDAIIRLTNDLTMEFDATWQPIVMP